MGEAGGGVEGGVPIQVTDLTRRFGATTALDSVSLSVARGRVHGLVGANGAGKTTLIRHVLGLLRAQSGSVRVFGLDPVADPVGVLSRLGYLSEENDLPDWMRVHELLAYSRAFRPAWDDDYADELGRTFGLDPSARVGALSKGQKARAGLLVALAYRPELLVLDEPSSGLDPIVRRDILAAVMRSIAQEGRTVLFSSHLLHEVEQVADHVTMISRGRIVLSAPLPDIRETHRSFTIGFREPRDPPPEIAGLLRWDRHGDDWAVLGRGASAELGRAIVAHGGTIAAERTPTLDEVFVAYAGESAGSDEERPP
jgi:ABC-2 type transport system ATP-binding protein